MNLMQVRKLAALSFAIGCSRCIPSPQLPSPDAASGMDGSTGLAFGDVCPRPFYPDGPPPPPSRQPCLTVHPISTATQCTVEGATIDIRTEDEGNYRLTPGFHGVTGSYGGCHGQFTLTVNHPDFEPFVATYRSFMDRFAPGNGSTQVVVLELTPRGQSMTDAGRERDGD